MSGAKDNAVTLRFTVRSFAAEDNQKPAVVCRGRAVPFAPQQHRRERRRDRRRRSGGRASLTTADATIVGAAAPSCHVLTSEADGPFCRVRHPHRVLQIVRPIGPSEQHEAAVLERRQRVAVAVEPRGVVAGEGEGGGRKRAGSSSATFASSR